MKKAYHYITFKLDNEMTHIVVDKTLKSNICDSDVANKRFLQELVEVGDCRYAVFNAQWQDQLTIKNKIVFFAWSPEDSPARHKMVYTASKDHLKKALSIVLELQGTTINEFDFKEVMARIMQGK
ncbi:uncharacterized protein LOC134697028 isoform X2 [Mytilus trossulus]